MTTPASSLQNDRMPNNWPAPQARTALLIATAFLASCFLTGWVGSTEDDVITGQLSAHIASLRAERDGRIEKWLVDTNQHVTCDAKLLLVADADVESLRDAKRHEVATLKSQLKRKQAQADIDLAWRLRTVDSEVLANRLKAAELLQREFDHRLELQVHKVALQNRGRRFRSASPDEIFRSASLQTQTATLTRTLAPIESQLTDMQKHEATRNAAEVANVQLRLCENRLRDLEQMKKDLPEKIREAAGITATEQQLESAKKELEALEQRATKRTLLSPAYGRVQPVVKKPGDQIHAGDVFAKIVDDERRFITLPVPAAKLARFDIGRDVILRFPGVKPCTGKVAALQNDDDGQVTAVIEPTGRLWPNLPLGTAVDVLVPDAE